MLLESGYLIVHCRCSLLPRERAAPAGWLNSAKSGRPRAAHSCSRSRSSMPSVVFTPGSHVTAASASTRDITSSGEAGRSVRSTDSSAATRGWPVRQQDLPAEGRRPGFRVLNFRIYSMS